MYNDEMLRSLIRYALLLLLHVFLVSLWVGGQADLWAAVDLIFYQAGGVLNPLVAVNLILLLWLIPILLRRVDARLAWGSLAYFVLGFIFFEGSLVSMHTSHQFGALTVDFHPKVGLAASLWGIASSVGMLFAIYLRGSLTSLRARHVARAAWWGRLCSVVAITWGVSVFSLMLVVGGALSADVVEPLSTEMWMHLLLMLLLCSFLILVVTARRARAAFYVCLLGAVAMGSYALISGGTQRLEFKKEGEQWVCRDEEGKKMERDLQLCAAEWKKDTEARVELVSTREADQERFELSYMQSRLKVDHSVCFDGCAASDHVVSSVKLTVTDRPGLMLAKLLLLTACGMLLLGRALRAAPEGLPRRR